MIYLQPESRPNTPEIEDDTFWLWFNRTFESSFDVPDQLKDGDVLLHYGTLGGPKQKGGEKIALLWELYPEMKKQGFSSLHVEEKILAMHDAYQACDMSLVACVTMLQHFPKATVLPIGVDTDRFRPNGAERQGVLWCGTDHPMKGLEAASAWDKDQGGVTRFVHKGDMKQAELAKAMSQAESFLFSSMLSPLYMVEWEALASGCKPVHVTDMKRDPDPWGNPRHFVFRQGWDRKYVEQRWREILKVPS